MALEVKKMAISRELSTIIWLVSWSLIMIYHVSLAERVLEDEKPEIVVMKKTSFFWYSGESSYERVWPEMKFGWRIVVGSIVGFFGAALGSVGGVGGGGIFIPMLTLIIGFDPKSSTALSKCMITGAAGSTVYCNLRLRHPTLDMPLIDYDLALLFQPMLMLGISIGVAFNVMFADWMVTILLIILFIGTSTKALVKGIDTWKKEAIMKKEAFEEAAQMLESGSTPDYASEEDYKSLPADLQDEEVPLLDNIHWKELSVLMYVWVAFLIVQILKTYSKTCSIEYWLLNSLQVPIAISVTLFEAICLCKGTRVIASRGKEITWKFHKICLYCFCGIIAGMVSGLLGLGGGFILGPLFLELGIPPQVASATSTFAMVFSSSMSVVQYYHLDRFPIPYASYLVLVATIAALTGQHVVRKIIAIFGRASIIVFILAFTIFVSAISLGGVGIGNMVEKMENAEYMGFDNLCHHGKKYGV
uniref:Sulfite exporter TauE/SafE family protein n=1 Tax=Medicago truncatula TaxID=3880 RepID=I3S415_MEDTR|nr:unknown [Medicago truncatula]